VTSPLDQQSHRQTEPAPRPFEAAKPKTGGRESDDQFAVDDRQFIEVPQLDFRMPSLKHPFSRPAESALKFVRAPVPRQGANLEHDALAGQSARGEPRPHVRTSALDDTSRHVTSLRDTSPEHLPLDLGKLAHELRTPIGAIVALAEVMRDERFGALGNPRYKGYANDIHQSARHALAVLTAMLDAGPGQNGHADPRGQMAFEPIELNALARSCVSGLQPVAAKAGIHLRTALNQQPLHLTADRRSLKQIVLNLLSNSLKFTPAGGTVTVATSATTDHPVGFRLDVRDTGIGMTEARRNGRGASGCRWLGPWPKPKAAVLPSAATPMAPRSPYTCQARRHVAEASQALPACP
jgi:signal transduction histidine kinase